MGCGSSKQDLGPQQAPVQMRPPNSQQYPNQNQNQNQNQQQYQQQYQNQGQPQTSPLPPGAQRLSKQGPYSQAPQGIPPGPPPSQYPPQSNAVAAPIGQAWSSPQQQSQ